MKIIDFLRRNKFGEYITPILDAYQTGISDYRGLFAEFNYQAVDYCMDKEN